MPGAKLTSMQDAIARHVPDGASVCVNTAIEALISFAAGHELIRQRRRQLTLIGPISDMLFDQLVGAGCVARIVAAWVGNVSAGLGHNYRRAVEKRIPAPIAVLDHSNLTLAFGLEAAARGIPYLPTRSLLGTDLLRSNPTSIAFTKRAAPLRATASGSSGGCTAWATGRAFSTASGRRRSSRSGSRSRRRRRHYYGAR